MPKITAKAPYRGFDEGDGNRAINLAKDESAEVSKAKADQLKADFPDRFDIGGGKRPTAKESASGKRRTTSAKRRTTDGG